VRKKILFFIRAFEIIGPQTIRFSEIIKYLPEEYDIHILCFSLDNDSPKLEKIENFTVHRIPYSFLGRIFNAGMKKRRFQHNAHKNNEVNIIKRIIRLVSKPLLFPDILIIDFLLRKNDIIKIMQQNFDLIVGSAFPFSILKVGKLLHSENIRTPFIYDIGDPFFQNPVNSKIRNYLAYKYETKYLKYVDWLVVTNNITKRHYISTFGIILRSKISVIPQAYPVLEVNSNWTNNLKKTLSYPLKLIYAGNFYKRLRNPFNLYKSIKYLGSNNTSLDIFGAVPKSLQCKNIDNIQFLGTLRYNDMIMNYQNYNVIVFMDNAFGLQTPGKIWELISLKKPILFITNRTDSPALEVMQRYNGCLIVKNEVNEIINGILRIIENSIHFTYHYDGHLYTWKDISSMYQDIFKKLS